jgi:hypothetical protein
VRRSQANSFVDPHLHTDGELVLDTKGYRNKEANEKPRHLSRAAYTMYDKPSKLPSERSLLRQAVTTAPIKNDINVLEEIAAKKSQHSNRYGRHSGKSNFPASLREYLS